MPNVDGVSHAQLLMWVGTYFFTGLVLYGGIMWLLVRKTMRPLSSQIVDMKKEICTNNKRREAEFKELSEDLIKLDNKKVEVRLYMDDKEEARQIVASLQTVDRCNLMQKACFGTIQPVLRGIQDDIKSVLNNQAVMAEERGKMDGKLDMVIERQKHVIDRVDGHMNGHSHK
jgi:hypothetical protein